MTARELINDSYPPLKLSDTGLKALGWMENFRLEHIPLVAVADAGQSKYIGLMTEADVLKLTFLDQPIENQPLSLSHPSVKATQPVFEVVKVLSKDKLTAVPVVDDENNYLGLIT